MYCINYLWMQHTHITSVSEGQSLGMVESGVLLQGLQKLQSSYQAGLPTLGRIRFQPQVTNQNFVTPRWGVTHSTPIALSFFGHLRFPPGQRDLWASCSLCRLGFLAEVLCQGSGAHSPWWRDWPAAQNSTGGPATLSGLTRNPQSKATTRQGRECCSPTL